MLVAPSESPILDKHGAEDLKCDERLSGLCEPSHGSANLASDQSGLGANFCCWIASPEWLRGNSVDHTADGSHLHVRSVTRKCVDVAVRAAETFRAEPGGAVVASRSR